MIPGGGLVAAGVALLVAPQSGQETRARIGNKAKDVQSELMKNVDELIEGCSEASMARLEMGSQKALE